MIQVMIGSCKDGIREKCENSQLSLPKQWSIAEFRLTVYSSIQQPRKNETLVNSSEPIPFPSLPSKPLEFVCLRSHLPSKHTPNPAHAPHISIYFTDNFDDGRSVFRASARIDVIRITNRFR